MLFRFMFEASCAIRCTVRFIRFPSKQLCRLSSSFVFHCVQTTQTTSLFLIHHRIFSPLCTNSLIFRSSFYSHNYLHTHFLLNHQLIQRHDIYSFFTTTHHTGNLSALCLHTTDNPKWRRLNLSNVNKHGNGFSPIQIKPLSEWLSEVAPSIREHLR